MRFVSIDFETANASPLSACSIGVVVFEDGVPVKSLVSLIQPPEEFGKFNWYNVKIHGIKQSMVQDAPTFDQVWERIREDVAGGIVVCHNAVFDTSVLRRLLEYYRIKVPEFRYICTVKVSQKLWPELENHKLDTVSEALGIRLNHHEALSDSMACGLILAKAIEEKQCDSVEALAEEIGMRLGSVSKKKIVSCSTAEEVRRQSLKKAGTRHYRRRRRQSTDSQEGEQTI